MDQLQEVQAQLEQWKAMGLGLNDLQAAAQTAYTGGTTPLGLNQWSLGDKPRMEDFNRDNARVDELIMELREELANKANKGTPEEFELDLANGFINLNTSSYFKTEGNQVILSFKVGRGGEAIPAGTYVIAVMPEGFRPVSEYIHLVVTDATFSGLCMIGYVTRDGETTIRLHTSMPASGTCGFAGSVTYIAQ